MNLTEYLNWLNNPKNRKCLLCVGSYHDENNVLQSFYFASEPFYSSPTDSIPNTYFENRIVGSTYISRSIPFFENGRGEDDFGGLEFDNSDYELDAWQKSQFRGRRVLILLGDPNWGYDDFLILPLLKGVFADKPTFSDDSVTISIRDIIGTLDGPIQSKLFTTGPHTDKPIPLAYGYVQNVEPVCINTSTYEYQVHDGQTSNIQTVYDKGLAVSKTVNNLTGKFTLTARPAGTVTCTLYGAAPGGITLSKLGDITKDILIRIGPLTTDDIDLDSFTQLNVELSATDWGIYISDRENRLDILDRLFGSAGAYYLPNQYGKIIVGRITNPENETPVAVFESIRREKSFLEGYEITDVKVESLNSPQWRTKLNYQKNWHTQSDGDIAGSITDPSYPDSTRVEWLKTEWRVAKQENIDVVPEEGGVRLYDLVTEPDAVDCYVDSESTALALAQHRQSILEKQRQRLSATIPFTPTWLLPGDIIRVLDSRYGLENGKNIQLLMTKIYPLDNVTEIEGWF